MKQNLLDLLNPVLEDMPFRLFDFPDELIIAVIDEIEDAATLKSVARTCSRLQALAEANLYREIFFRSDNQLRALHKSLQQYDRMKYLHHLEVRCTFAGFTSKISHDDSAASPLVAILLEAKNIETFTFESPYCNSNRWTTSRFHGWEALYVDLAFPFWQAVEPLRKGPARAAGLQSLTSLELHLNGRENKEFYHLDDSWFPILLHPTLETLKISSANISGDLVERFRRPTPERPEIQPVSKTPLKSLKLDECNINNDGLHAILALPRALEHLYLGEQQNCTDYYGGFQSALTDNPTALIAALSQQNHSLKTLFHILNSHGSHVIPPKDTFGTGFQSFTALESIALESSPSYGMATCLHAMLLEPSTSPPALLTLSFNPSPLFSFIDLTPWPTRERELALFNNMLCSNTSLKKLSLDFRRDMIAQSVPPIINRLVTEVDNACAKHEVELTVYRQASRTSFVAPILYGETEAAPTLVFNSYLGWKLPQWQPGDDDDVQSDWESDDGWVDEQGDDVDEDDIDWEDEQSENGDEHVGDNDDWWEAP